MRMSWTWGLPLEGTSSSFFQTVGSSLLYNNRKARQAQWSLNPSVHKSAAAGMTLLYQSNLSLYKLPLKSWMWTLKAGIQGRIDVQICFTSPLQLNLVIKRLLTWLCSASLVNSGLVLTQKEKRHGLSCTGSGWFHKTHVHTRLKTWCAGTPQNGKKKPVTPCAAFMNAHEHFWKLIIPEAELTWGPRMTERLMGFCFTTKYVRCRCALTHSYISFMAHKIHRCIAPSVNETTTAMIFNKLILALSFFPVTIDHWGKCFSWDFQSTHIIHIHSSRQADVKAHAGFCRQAIWLSACIRNGPVT